jgi:hypothetical protein
MWESNCCDSRMAACHQKVRNLEEKFHGFKLHHVLRHNNKAADTLTQLGPSHEQPPLGVLLQDLIKSSIQLNEDSPAPASGTLPGEGGLAPTLEIDLGTPTGPTS